MNISTLEICREMTMEAIKMTEIDARGLSCPIPVVKTQQLLDNTTGTFCVLVDEHVQVENIKRLAQSRGFSVEVHEEEDTFRIVMERKDAGHE